MCIRDRLSTDWTKPELNRFGMESPDWDGNHILGDDQMCIRDRYKPGSRPHGSGRSRPSWRTVSHRGPPQCFLLPFSHIPFVLGPGLVRAIK